MSKDILSPDELGKKLEGLQARMRELDAAIQAAGEDVEADVLEALEASHEEALAETTRTVAAIDRFERTEAAISRVPRDKGDDSTAPAGTLSRVKDALVYAKRGSNSFFKDMWMARSGNPSASERLRRHERQVEVERPELYREHRDLSIGGGVADFIPPIYLADEWAELARAGRPLADFIGSRPLPDSGMTLTVPKIATGVAVGMQAAEADPATETDATDTVVTFAVKTASGQQDLSVQLFERSSPGMDEVIGQDLAAAYATNVDNQVINGSDASGQVEGILAADGVNAVTYTDATPTAGEIYAKVADSIQRIHAGRFLPPDVIVMAPRRWGFFLGERDTTGRPLIIDGGLGLNNALASFGGVVPQGVVGVMQGLPVLVDPSIPTNLGASTDEDSILVLKSSDLLLFESPVRARVLSEILSGTLQVRLQVYGYLAFTAERFPKSVSIITGTGLKAPTFV